MVAADVEGDGGEVEWNGGFDPVEGPVEQSCEGKRWVCLRGRVNLCAREGGHFFVFVWFGVLPQAGLALTLVLYCRELLSDLQERQRRSVG